MEPRPVSKVCPTCGGTEYGSVKPQGFVAFVSDRKCKSCGTKYKLPTPVWAALVFVIAGSILLLAGASSLALILMTQSPNVCAMATSACALAGGGLAAFHGTRALIQPGRV